MMKHSMPCHSPIKKSTNCSGPLNGTPNPSQPLKKIIQFLFWTMNEGQSNYYPTRDQFLQDMDCVNPQYIGGGTYGRVFKMKSKLTGGSLEAGQVYAVKYIEATNEQIFNKIQNEFVINKLIDRHPNIVMVEKVYAWQEYIPKKYVLVLVMELANRSLQKEIEVRKHAGRAFTEDELLSMFYSCFSAFNDLLASRQIFHRDIKPENILLSKPDSLEIKITDFGVSKTLYRQKIRASLTNTLVGTPVYLSPKLWSAFILGKEKNIKVDQVKHDLEKSDIFSLGISFLQCALLLTTEIVGLNQQGGPDKIALLLGKIGSQRVRSLIAKMLDHDEGERYSYRQILDTFFTQRVSKQSDNKIFNDSHQSFDSTQISSSSRENACSNHPDQLIRYYCYAPEVANFVCEKCMISFNQAQTAMALTLPELDHHLESDEQQDMVEEIKKSMEIEESSNEFYRLVSERMQQIFIEVVKNHVEAIQRQQTAQTQLKIEELDLKVQKIKSLMYNFGKGDKNNISVIQEAIIKKLELDTEIQQLIRQSAKKQLIDRVLSDPQWNSSVQRQFEELIRGPIERISERSKHMEVTVKEVEFVKQQQRKKIFDLTPSPSRSIMTLPVAELNCTCYGKQQRVLTLLDRKKDATFVAIAQGQIVWGSKNVVFRENLEARVIMQLPTLNKTVVQIANGPDSSVILGCDDGAIIHGQTCSHRVTSPVTALSVGELGVLSGHLNGKLYNHTKDKELTQVEGAINSIVQYKHTYIFSQTGSGKINYYAKDLLSFESGSKIARVVRIDANTFASFSPNEPILRVWSADTMSPVTTIQLLISPQTLTIQTNLLVYANQQQLVVGEIGTECTQQVKAPGTGREMQIAMFGSTVGVVTGEVLLLYSIQSVV